MMAPVSVPGWAALACCNTASTFSPRAWLRIWPKLGLPVSLMAKESSVFSTGALLS